MNGTLAFSLTYLLSGKNTTGLPIDLGSGLSLGSSHPRPRGAEVTQEPRMVRRPQIARELFIHYSSIKPHNF